MPEKANDRMKRVLDDLSRPEAYPETMGAIEVVQTHISMVFLGERLVYKIKKPVDFGFLDFTTLEKRKFYCEEEVRLNSPRAPGIYLGVRPVYRDEEGHFTLKPVGGEVVEYAVKMTRIPDELVLKHRFEARLLDDDDLERIAKRVAKMHANAARSDTIDRFGRLETIKFNAHENFEQTEGYIGRSITAEQYERLKHWTDAFFANEDELLKRRIEEGHIRDCHGDLHMEHIIMSDPIAIIDCIEFNERFRYSDTAADIGFLLMDLEYNDGAAAAETIAATYAAAANEDDDAFARIVQYYKIYRAYVRGKVISFMLDDPEVPKEKKEDAARRAQQYFALAASYLDG